ncbi:MAG: hypothetical protein H0V17_07865 [Deltaproteobacteria bacterium]|nr:hypothetical protein [Deltaproteobacteria bacterium]
MTELVRGQISDRPWGLTFGQLGLREITGQLTVHAVDGRDYRVAFERGAVVGATSPQPTDSATRIAMTSGLISSSQVANVARQIAATPEIDEIALLASACRLSPEQVSKLHRRVIAQRAARTFSVESGAFVVEDEITIAMAPEAAVDVRAVVYQGARMNLSEVRLLTELKTLGSHFTLGETAIGHAEWFGIDPPELPILDLLVGGTSLPALEAKHRELDPRSVQAVIYALVSCRECIATNPVEPVVRPRTPTPQSPDGISVSFRPRTGEHTIPDSIAIAVPRTATAKGALPRPTSPEPSAEAEFRTANGTRAGIVAPRTRTAAPTTPPLTLRAKSSTVQPPLDGNPASPTIGPTSTTAPPTLDNPAAAIPGRPKSETAPWPRGKTPTIPPSSSSGMSIPRTLSQNPTGAPRELGYSEGTDRITQSLSEAAESFKRGVDALHAHQLPLAFEQLMRASTLNPHEFEYSAMLAFAQLANALPGDRPKSADKVRKMLTHLTQKSREPVQAMVFLGQLERLLNNDKQAIVHFRAALAAQPDHNQAAIEIQQIEDKVAEKGFGGFFRKK